MVTMSSYQSQMWLVKRGRVSGNAVQDIGRFAGMPVPSLKGLVLILHFTAGLRPRLTQMPPLRGS
jgi:hypothetical protein